MENKNIGGLWNRRAKSGLEYQSGSIEIGGVKHYFSVFRNTKKNKDSQPDFQIVRSDYQGEQKGRLQQPAKTNNYQQGMPGFDDSNIPF